MSEIAPVNGIQGPGIALLARRVLIVQSALGAVVSLIFLGLEGPWAALSALLGAGCALVPNMAFFALLRGNVAQSPDRFIRLFRRGESLKMLLTFLMFGIVLLLQIPDLRALPLFIGFALVLLGHWFSLLPSLKTEAKHGS